MSNNKVMFVRSFSFEKKNGGTGYGFEFLEFSVKDNKKIAQSRTIYSDNPIDVKSLTPGDIVEVSFVSPNFLGAAPVITAIDVLERSVFFED